MQGSDQPAQPISIPSQGPSAFRHYVRGQAVAAGRRAGNRPVGSAAVAMERDTEAKSATSSEHKEEAKSATRIDSPASDHHTHVGSTRADEREVAPETAYPDASPVHHALAAPFAAGLGSSPDINESSESKAAPSVEMSVSSQDSKSPESGSGKSTDNAADFDGWSGFYPQSN